MPLLEVEDLHIHFRTPRGIAEVINGVSLTIEAGEAHGLVGESGSGKSVTSRSLLGLLPRNSVAMRSGLARYNGTNLLQLSEHELREQIRGQQISMVFQDPMTALAPATRVGAQLTMPLRRHLKLSRKAARERALDILAQVGIPDPVRRFGSYPHEMSGGQRQRIMIAIAIACDPKLLVADEATTALDVTVQAQILDLFDQLREERNLSILMVSHDLGLIAERCDTVSVMYAGRVVEHGSAQEVFERPEHPYTRLLSEARPKLGERPHVKLPTIPGSVSDRSLDATGCAFSLRCPNAQPDCTETEPALTPTVGSRSVACRHPHDLRTALSAAAT